MLISKRFVGLFFMTTYKYANTFFVLTIESHSIYRKRW